MRTERERLLDIMEAIEQVKKYAARGKASFENDELIQTWIIHHLQIIGEASSRLPNDYRAKHPTIPWPKIIGMRNILVHEYFGINTELVWVVVEKELPNLEVAITQLLSENEPHESGTSEAAQSPHS